MTSISGDATTPSPKAARIMVEMIKLGDQMKRISYEDEEMMERMRKENEEQYEYEVKFYCKQFKQ